MHIASLIQLTVRDYLILSTTILKATFSLYAVRSIHEFLV